MDIDIDEINKNISKDVSDGDIQKYFDFNVSKDIIKYSELHKYKSIEQLLPKNKSFKIILLESEPSKGHWLVLLRYNKTIEFFDSYGSNMDTELKYIPAEMNKKLHQDHYYDKLIKEASKRFNVIHNKKKFQEQGDQIQTCGRHSLLRLFMLLDFNMDLYHYIYFMKELKKEYGLSYDQLVSWLILT